MTSHCKTTWLCTMERIMQMPARQSRGGIHPPNTGHMWQQWCVKSHCATYSGYLNTRVPNKVPGTMFVNCIGQLGILIKKNIETPLSFVNSTERLKFLWFCQQCWTIDLWVVPSVLYRQIFIPGISTWNVLWQLFLRMGHFKNWSDKRRKFYLEDRRQVSLVVFLLAVAK